ncbi:MAG: hypothetical protein J5700_07005, partial [Treponema sp.]|nr:hypothetical protein [Treponema sp.]
MDYKAAKTAKQSVVYFFMVLFILIAVVPVWLMLVNATRTTEQINAGVTLLPGKSLINNWNILITTGSGLKVAAGGRLIDELTKHAKEYAGKFAKIGDWIIFFKAGKFQIWQGFLNSAIIAICSTGLNVYFSALTAYALHVYRFKGRAFIWAFIMFV